MIASTIRPFIREAHLFYLSWALAEIDPLHPDVPAIVLKRRQLINERHATNCYLRRAIQWL
jgi:hypothetical protein